MNEKEVGELRRRFKSEKSSITHIFGCYVNDSRQILAEFDQSLGMMTEEEQDRLLTLLRKSLSGGVGKNLVDLSFPTQEVASGTAHRLLMRLRGSKLQDAEAVHTLYETISQNLSLDGDYLILLGCDAYDVPWRGKDGQDQDEAGSEVFTYLVCSICPVKQTKPGLRYDRHENQCHERVLDWLISAPELGFLFPAFDGRSTNLYGALLYTRGAAETYPELIDAVFHSEAPMPAQSQKESFRSLLGDSLGADCRIEVVQAVQEQLCDMMQAHKENHEREPLVVSKTTVRRILEQNGVPEEKAEAFETQYDETFGADTELPPRNLVETNKYELRTAEVSIQVDPEHRDLVQSRVIDGVKYLLIRADGSVSLNGVTVQL